MFETHPNIDTPEDNAVIWRYLDISRLLVLLSTKSLHLCRLDKFRDPWEGTWPKPFVTSMAPQFSGPGQSFVELSEKLRESHFVSCWHESKTESAALWDLYARESGVAIRSTVGLLKKAINDPKKYYIGRVHYLDFEGDQLGQLNMLIAPFLKRRSFEHEREVRVLNWSLSEGNAPPNGQDINWHSNLRIDSSILIEKLYVSPVAPSWLVPALKDLCAKFGVQAQVEHSSLYDPRLY